MLRLSFEMLCEPDALGITIPLQADSISGIVYTPWVEDGSLVGSPTPPIPQVLGAAVDQPSPGGDTDWGESQFFSTSEHELYRVRAVMVELTGVELTGVEETDPTALTHEQRTRLFESIDGWIERLRLWHGACARQYTGPRRHIPGERLHLWQHADGAITFIPHSPHFTVDARAKVMSLDAAAVLLLVEKSNSGEDPPLERTLIVEARNHLSARRFRAAVLDAAAALELVLHQEMTRRLAVIGPSVPKLLLDRVTLGTLVDLVGLDYSGVTDTNKAITSVRNRVAHQGAVPTLDEATFIVGVAEATVNQLATPLPISWN